MFFKPEITDPKSQARAGRISTAHGHIPTPVFMPVGTAGSVKGVHQRELKDDLAAPIILGNTYHLYLRPQAPLLEAAGGLHRFMGWQGSILTDSGGYQVYSLKDRLKISEEGVRFKSHIDGSFHTFTPESVMDIERSIGGDIIMAFDECAPYPADYQYIKQSMERTHRWLDRCIARHKGRDPLYGYPQYLFPIVQGGCYPDLRKISAEYVVQSASPGYAIGGLSVGEPTEKMYEMAALVCGILPKDSPRYLMGVGTPWNILEGISLGIDMFDCVMPTRNGRNGMLFTARGVINIKNEKWKADVSPIDEQGYTYVDTAYSKAYLRHLFAADEYLGKQIASIHNLGFYLWLVREAREKIKNGVFSAWKAEMISQMQTRL